MTEIGIAGPSNQPAIGGRPIVTFDFDGTLTVSDSFTGFLRWRAGARAWTLGLVRLTPSLIAYAGHHDRGVLKAAAVRRFLRGVPRAELEAEALRYADQAWGGSFRPDALACWDDWGRRGAFRVIVTASPELTVAPFAARLGADLLLGTQLAFDDHNHVSGAFAGENCRGAEKVRRLREAFGPEIRLAAAYGDTSGDREMLAIADAPGFRVFTATPTPEDANPPRTRADPA